MANVIMTPYVSFADYVEAEQSSDVKHEWFHGSVYAMSRGSPEHARLSAQIVWLIGNGLPRGCAVYSSDLMLYVADANLSTYADASVVCGPLETITVKRNGRSLGEDATNPTVIIEVLSESTERYDREEKFEYYRTLPSLQEYVLVSQDSRAIEVFHRPGSRTIESASAPETSSIHAVRVSALVASRDRWEYEIARAGGTVTIHGCPINVDAVYGAHD